LAGRSFDLAVVRMGLRLGVPGVVVEHRGIGNEKYYGKA